MVGAQLRQRGLPGRGCQWARYAAECWLGQETLQLAEMYLVTLAAAADVAWDWVCSSHGRTVMVSTISTSKGGPLMTSQPAIISSLGRYCIERQILSRFEMLHCGTYDMCTLPPNQCYLHHDSCVML